MLRQTSLLIRKLIWILLWLMLSACIALPESYTVAKNVAARTMAIGPNVKASQGVWPQPDVIVARHEVEMYDFATLMLVAIDVNTAQPVATVAGEHPRSVTCRTPNYLRMRSLSNGGVGNTVQCYPEDVNQPRSTFVYQWRVGDAHQELLFEVYDFLATDFALSPDGKFALLEEAGDGVFNRLYRYDIEQQKLDDAYSDWQRVGIPDWSSAGIVFGGTGPNARKTEPPAGALELGAAGTAPWGIYYQATAQDEPTLWLDGVRYLRDLQWIPGHTHLILFQGDMHSRRGLWLYDKVQDEIVFLWETDADRGDLLRTDVSPDGQHVLIFQDTYPELGIYETNDPVIIDIAPVISQLKE